MRIAIVGTSGSGKTSLARRLGAQGRLPVVELDALNWGPNWFNRSRGDPGRFVESVVAAITGESWIVDGNYLLVQPIILARATDVIWLDYARHVVMRRVLSRSLTRALSRRELWPGTGNRESWRLWQDREHPIRWAWDTHAANRARYESVMTDPGLTHLRIHRLRTRFEAEQFVPR